MTGQVELRVESFRRMMPCATARASSSNYHSTLSMSQSHRFTVYEEQIFKAIEDLSELLADSSIVSYIASYRSSQECVMHSLSSYSSI